MKCRGFSLIELLVVATIVLLTTGGTMVFVNRSNAEQKITSTKNELVANLRMARDYARTLQVPEGYESTLAYVVVGLTTGGQMTVYPMPGGTPYYSSIDISPAGVGVSMFPSELFFAAYEGKLLKTGTELGGTEGETTIVPRGASEIVTMVISSTEGIGTTELIKINSVGLIDENRPASGGGGYVFE